MSGVHSLNQCISHVLSGTHKWLQGLEWHKKIDEQATAGSSRSCTPAVCARLDACARACMHVRLYGRVCMCASGCCCVCMRTCTSACLQYVCARSRACACVCMCTRAYASIHVRMCTRAAGSPVAAPCLPSSVLSATPWS